MPDTALMLHPVEGALHIGSQALSAIAGDTSQVFHIQPCLFSTSKELAKTLGTFFSLGDDGRKDQTGDAVRQHQHHPFASSSQFGPQAIDASTGGVGNTRQLTLHAFFRLNASLIQPAMHRTCRQVTAF